VLLLQCAEAREGGEQALAVCLGVVDARQQRLCDLVERLRAEAAADERGQGFILAVAARGDEQVQPHAQLAER